MLPPPPLERVAVPPASPAPPRSPFPWAATLAPVVVSLGVWIVTRSVFSLMFAVLGPLVALGGLVDGRVSRRRSARRDRQRNEAALDRVVERVEQLQQRELERLTALVASPTQPAWDSPAGSPVPVRLGSGPGTRLVELTGDDLDEPRLGRLRTAAAPAAAGAPILLDAADGIGVTGPAVLAAAVARSLAVQVGARLSPARVALRAPEGEDWVRAGPHPTQPEASAVYRWVTREGAAAVVAWASTRSELPAGCGVVVELGGGDLVPDAVTRAQAREWATTLAERARALGALPATALLPERVELSTLLPPAAGAGLSAPIGVAVDGPVSLDLVADGPHALIAGTTGSGKSEMLVSWVLGMAHGRHPDEVTFVLIDFKGGAAFAPLAGLPHVLATLSDLDSRLTRRAVESLRAELLRRERLLAEHRVRDIDGLPTGVLARLVLVVDEFAALVSAGPELHDVFADVAARGRSLGLHLILCTQRPAGVVRDAVLANIGLRISLRVTDRGDSIAMVGDDAAARLPADPRGRAILAHGSATRAVHIALAGAGDAERIAAATQGDASPRPWCEPLPAQIGLDDLNHPAGEPGLPFGRVDLTDEQRQPPAVHDPARHGHLLVLGAAGSGVTTALATLAESARRSGASVRVLASDPADAWAQLEEFAGERTEHLSAVRPLLVLDDLDSILARMDEDHRLAFGAMLERLLRGGGSASPALLVGARRLTGQLTGMAGLFGSRLLLRQNTREDHVLAGGEAAGFDPQAPAGSGRWRGAVVQVARSQVPLPGAAVPTPVHVTPAAYPVLAVVAGRPRSLTDGFRAAGARVIHVGGAPVGEGVGLQIAETSEPVVLVGDPDAWQADWALLATARREWPIVLIGCTSTDLRTLVRHRETPPPLGSRHGECWLVADGRVIRAVLDASAPAETSESEAEVPQNH